VHDRRDSRGVGRTQRRQVKLVRVWPDIAETLAPEERQVAERLLSAPLLTARDAALPAVLAAECEAAFGFLVVEGAVLKETILGTISALEVLGPGDVLAPPLTRIRQLDFRAVSRYVALGDVSIAALGVRFTRVAARWPQISTFLHARLGEQTHHASMNLAMLHLPRAQDRIIALFTDLGERFGRVTADGIVIDLPLTHDLVGRLIGSRRPTVSLALQTLDDQGALSRVDNRWLLATSQTSS
jgi:CRP/FNR family transcriptional regulator, cyclic AMP receptor protein